ncbi:MAG: hypothetical protein RIR14_1661 [Pseudomonadota bacterium]
MPTPAPSSVSEAVAEPLRSLLSAPATPASLNRALRHLAKWRAELVANTLIQRSGGVVLSGPFQGMLYEVRAAEGSRAARLIGAYEASLHPVIEEIVARAPDLVIDIGSAEGYYAVGLARRLPGARVLARDASDKAQDLCRTLAAANGVADRVEVGGLWSHADFAVCAKARAVVICDIEGAEEALLDPVAAPGLIHADILVECHPGISPGVTERLAARFAPTHRLRQIGRKLDDSGLPGWMENLSDLDRLLALWEWRAAPTPWLWMEKR